MQRRMVRRLGLDCCKERFGVLSCFMRQVWMDRWISCQCRLGYASGWLARRSFWRKTPAWQQYRDQLTCDEMFARPSRMRLIYDLHDIQRSGWRIPVEASRQKPDSNCHLGRGINKKDCSDSIDLVQESSSAPVIDTTLFHQRNLCKPLKYDRDGLLTLDYQLTRAWNR